MAKSAPKIPQVSTEVNDLIETSELIRATHALARSVFGAFVIYKDVLSLSDDDLKRFAKDLDTTLSFLRFHYSAFLSIIESKKNEQGSRVGKNGIAPKGACQV